MKCSYAANIILAALLAGAAPAGAATITVGGPEWTDPGLLRLDFSRFPVCGQGGDLETEAGSFSTRGGPGQLGTVCGDASRAQVRQGTAAYIELSGRNGDEYWLDSNDNETIDFKLRRTRKVQFLTSDLADVYGFFRLQAGDASYEINEFRENGERFLFTVIFDPDETDRTITLTSTRNDGFSIGPVVFAPIPVPAAGFLLLGAVGVLAAVRRGAERSGRLSAPGVLAVTGGLFPRR